MAAAWLKSSSESTKRPTAKTHGCARTVSAMPPTIVASLAAKKDEPIHETPRMQTIATRPPRMTLPFKAASGSGRKSSIMRPAAASIRIMMARLISTRPVFTAPSAAVWTYSGRSAGKMPSSTTAMRAARKRRQQPIAARPYGSRAGAAVAAFALGVAACVSSRRAVLRVVGELGAAPGDAGDAGEQSDQRRRHDHHEDLRERHRAPRRVPRATPPSRPRSARRSGRAGPR